MAIERTFVMLKPDAVQRALAGEIISRIERAGLKIVAMKMVKPSKELVSKHYPETPEWFAGLGNRTLTEYKTLGIDVKKQFGTEDSVQIGKVVKKWLVDFIASSPVIAIVWEGNQAITQVRRLVGGTVPGLAQPGTIRGDYSIDTSDYANFSTRPLRNLIHASGDKNEAENEIGLWFKPEEINKWQRADEKTMFG